MNNFSRRGKRQWILCSLSVSWEFVFWVNKQKNFNFSPYPTSSSFRNESNNSYTLFHISSPLHKIYVVCNMQRLARMCHSHVLHNCISILKYQFHNVYPVTHERKLFTWVWSGSCKKSHRKLSFYHNDYQAIFNAEADILCKSY